MNIQNAQLKKTVHDAIRRLGATMFYARHEVYGGQCCHFEALDLLEQAAWIDRAAEFLKTIDPGPPEGVNDSLFQFAAQNARDQFAPTFKE